MHAGYETYGLHWRKPTNSREARRKSTNGREKKKFKEILMRLPEQYFYNVLLKKQEKTFHSFFSLKWQPKI